MTFKERRGYSPLKEGVLDRTMWRARFGSDIGPLVRHYLNECKLQSVVSYFTIHSVTQILRINGRAEHEWESVNHLEGSRRVLRCKHDICLERRRVTIKCLQNNQ